MSPARRVEAVVVGAGPYGLAAASHLAALGVGARVFGWPMSGWSDHMPDGMFLKSTALDSNIGAPSPGFGIAAFCAARGITPYDDANGERPIPVGEFIDYGRWYQERLVPGVERALVTSVSTCPGGLRVEVDTEESFVAASVVVSAGVAPFPHVPVELRLNGVDEHSAKHLVSHAADHADLSLLSDREVAVVGTGQSGLETAVLLQEAGATVHLIGRTSALRWGSPPSDVPPGRLARLLTPPSPLGASWTHLMVTRFPGAYRQLPSPLRLAALKQILGPFGSWWLHERFGNAIDVRLGTRVRAAQPDGNRVTLSLAGGERGTQRLTVDHVIAATGYRVDLSGLGFLSQTLRSSVSTLAGSPRLSRHFESSVPGLYFSGLAAAATFGPVLRFVHGTRFAGQRVALGVANRLANS